jgi:hypothetical protein
MRLQGNEVNVESLEADHLVDAADTRSDDHNFVIEGWIRGVRTLPSVLMSLGHSFNLAMDGDSVNNDVTDCSTGSETESGNGSQSGELSGSA